MNYCDELIAQKKCSDPSQLKKIALFIVKDMQRLGINYVNENSERVAENHAVELSVRMLDHDMLNDTNNPFDRKQVTDSAWDKAKHVQKDIHDTYGIQITEFETFLLSTHFMINSSYGKES